MSIPRIQTPTISIPRNVIERIPPPVVRGVPAPVTNNLEVPIIDVPNPVIEYPTIDVPTEQDFQNQMEQREENNSVEEPTRSLPTPEPIIEVPSTPPPTPSINVGGIEAPLPDVAPLITAGATAVVTTTVTLGATIAVSKIKDAVIEPMMKRASSKKKKIKIKQVKPVLHFVQDEGGQVDVYEYTQKGTKPIDSTEDVERYLRDQVEQDSLYEMDNKIIIDDVIKDKFTKEGAKRFKSLFAPAKSIAKKLGARFSI